MRTLVATALKNAKGADIYCAAKKVNEHDIEKIKNHNEAELKAIGFTFIRLLSLEHSNVKGKAIFFEGHLDEMHRSLQTLSNF